MGAWRAVLAAQGVAPSRRGVGLVKRIDIVVPAFDEEGSVLPFYERLSPVIDALDYRVRVVFVDDGSTDRTAEEIGNLALRDPRVGLLRLSRNFGHQAALTAGLDAVDADAVITMDIDLQHPPEKIPAFIAAWENGAELVSGVRASAASLGAFKRVTSTLFYRVLNRLASYSITVDSPDFRLLDRKAVEAVRAVREQSRFLRGIYAWVGFRQASVPYDEGERAAGDTHYRTVDMLLLALAAVLSFSRLPLRLATYLGLMVSGLAFAFGIYALVMNLVFHEVIRGWTSLAVLLSFLSGVQLMFLGVLGEYLGQVLDETKRRPLYIVSEARLPSSDAPPPST
jgi:glycosyltransferase involved in cell wall biosynthesis